MTQAIALAVILGVVGGLTGAWLLQRYPDCGYALAVPSGLRAMVSTRHNLAF